MTQILRLHLSRIPLTSRVGVVAFFLAAFGFSTSTCAQRYRNPVPKPVVQVGTVYRAILDDSPAEQENATGVVFGSTGRPLEFNLYFSEHFRVRRLDKPEVYYFGSIRKGYSDILPAVQPRRYPQRVDANAAENLNIRGRLSVGVFSARLPVGKYELVDMAGRYGRRLWAQAQPLLSVPFTVHANRALYLGQLVPIPKVGVIGTQELNRVERDTGIVPTQYWGVLATTFWIADQSETDRREAGIDPAMPVDSLVPAILSTGHAQVRNTVDPSEIERGEWGAFPERAGPLREQ